ncbi:hypothetical protein [Thiohalomonas denitrificans]|uniref:Uncharacterized protein n=1 Tax=Thiohalomonas denitrificans TaxID=415747 RepID=A0A1G5R117_9GAMM|nr:hypothetical protein [Thiohalomonas denitrificans]SCZ67548.1 hypothetical protein SAMN03097708_03160 [Thiohalomonas denitrificans]
MLYPDTRRAGGTCTGLSIGGGCSPDRSTYRTPEDGAIATTYVMANRSPCSATDPTTDGSIETRIRAGINGDKHNRKNQKS